MAEAQSLVAEYSVKVETDRRALNQRIVGNPEITNNAAENYGSVPLSRSTTARKQSTIPKQQITRSHEQFTWFGKDAYIHGEGKNFTMNLKTITDDCRE